MADWIPLDVAAPMVNRSVPTLRRWCRQGMPHIREGRVTYTTVEHAQAALRRHAQADRAKAVPDSRPVIVTKHLTRKYVNTP